MQNVRPHNICLMNHINLVNLELLISFYIQFKICVRELRDEEKQHGKNAQNSFKSEHEQTYLVISS
jgi:hypothetical protein